MVKINRKTRKIKRTKKFNRKVSSKVFKNNIKRIIEKKTRKLKGGLKKKTHNELTYESHMNYLKTVIDKDKLLKIKTDKDVNIEDILIEDNFDNILIKKIKEIFETYGIKTIHDLKTYVFNITEKFSLFKKKQKQEQKQNGKILFISEEEAKLWLTNYFYIQKSSGNISRIKKLEGIINFEKEKQNFVIFDNAAIKYEPNQKPSDLILHYFKILRINNMTDFNVQINPNTKSSETPINNSTESNEISPILYTDWPDKGVPTTNIEQFKLFCEKLKQHIIQNGKDVTTLIHCSAGVGRTGTLYVILDLMFEYDIDKCDDLKNKFIDEEKLIEKVIETITNARKYRTTIVQSSAQFQFILKVFGVKIIHKEDEYEYNELHNSIYNYDTYVDAEKKCELAKKCINSKSNRYINILPFNKNIVKLTPEPNNIDECENYINASHMNNFKGGFKVIAAQCPLPGENNIRNFIRMLFDNNVGIIAMLTKLKELGKAKCSDYTTDSTLSKDNDASTLSKDNDNIGILVRTLNLQKNEDDFTFTKKSEPSNYLTFDLQSVLHEG